jgi:hypothetical protein
MGNGRSKSGRPAGDDRPEAAITAAILELAYATWAHHRRERDQDTNRALFDRAYLGHYSSLDSCVIGLVDTYGLDAKLDAAIAQPFRRHVDIDVTALGQDMVASGTLYALPAAPVGVWVFNGEIG